MENKYIISKEINNRFNNHLYIYDYVINHNYKPNEVSLIKNENKSLVVIGDFINAIAPDNNLMENTKILFDSKNIEELLEKSKFFSGRYLIIFGMNDQLKYILPDPVVTIPVNYSFLGDSIQISSHAKYIADEFSLEQSAESIRIKEGAEQQQALPYNISMFDEIKVMIPNHFLSLSNKKMERFFPIEYLETVSMEEVVNETIKYAKSILEGYFKTKKLALPMTSGYDSRAILALMKDYIDEIEMYTFSFDNFTLDTGDIKVPNEISKYLNMDYHILPVNKVPLKDQERIYDELIGVENKKILDQAYTYYSSQLSNFYAVPGEVITISKSLFGKKLPESLATVNYLMTKTHNYAPEAKKHIQNWLKDVKKNSQQYNVSLYDLFALEHRLGRWLPKSIQNYDYFMNQIYIFNNRYLIQLWMSVSKKERTEKSLHEEIIKKEWPELMNFPFNPDDDLRDKLFSNSYLFYIGSHLKYFINKYRSIRK